MPTSIMLKNTSNRNKQYEDKQDINIKNTLPKIHWKNQRAQIYFELTCSLQSRSLNPCICQDCHTDVE